MAIPVAIIGYGLLRQALVGVARSGAASRIAQKFGVNKATAEKFAKQFYAVQSKGKSKVSLGRGKNKQEVVSDGTKISVPTTTQNVDKINKFKSSSEGQKLYKDSLAFGKGPSGVASAEGQGLLSTVKDQTAKGVGFLKDRPIATATGVTALGSAGLLTSGEDPTVEEMQTLPKENQEIPKLNMKDYNEYKLALNRYKRTMQDKTFLQRATAMDDPNNPINDPKYQLARDLYQYDPENPDRIMSTDNDVAVGKPKDGLTLNADTVFQANMRRMELEEQQKNASSDFGALDRARAAIQTGAAITGVEKEGDSKKYPGYALLGAQDDRNILERTFDIGETPKYVKKVFDANTNTYIVPNKDDPRYDIYTEDEIASGKRNVVVPGTIQDPTTGIISTGENVTATENLRPNVTTTMADGTISNTQADKPQDVPLFQDTGNMFALANYLGQMSQNRGSFMGQQVPPQGFFDNRTPQQQFYGSRPLGFFDADYYKKLGFFD